MKWNYDSLKQRLYSVDLAVQCHDRGGLLIEILNALNAQNAQIYKVNAKLHPSNNTTTITMTILVKDIDTLNHYINVISSVKSVYQIDRIYH